ncbi:MAG: outer membrane lipid asymmetry maintenance protein MlaD [Burkholderiales bacterium]|jgi:phospholipid/cholesterol/gamma-HCH transport system substrate-binding protein|nr:outer membrane lipid asymmetry maintenance protein MlaD [Burkholderiales bacterium]
MQRATIDLWVGIFVAIGVISLVFLALKVGNLMTWSNAPSYRVEAHFDNIGGLKLRAPVKAAGVVVGRVENITLDSVSYEAIATLNIDQRYRFSKDTIASILTSGLLGEVYVGFDVGGDEETLKDGDTIIKTQSAVILEKLIGQFMLNQASSLAQGDHK